MGEDLLAEAAKCGDQANEKYYEWIRLMLSLCTGSLTALIALQKNYVSGTLTPLYLLWATWTSLAICVVLAAIVLRGEGLVLRAMSRHLAQKHIDRHNGIEANSRADVIPQPIACRLSANCLPCFLALSMILLCGFGISNSYESLQAKTPKQIEPPQGTRGG